MTERPEFPKIPEMGEVITFKDYRNGKITRGQVITTTTDVVLVSMWNKDDSGGYLWIPWLNIIVEKPPTFKVEGAVNP